MGDRSVLTFIISACSIDDLGYENVNACLFESESRNAKEGKSIQTCLEIGTMEKQAFLETCRDVHKASKKKLADMKLETIESCPINPVATCNNVLEVGFNRKHYGRSEDYLKQRKRGCTGYGGKWQQLGK